jgi:preprotein translocase subunit YajC
MSFLPMLAFIVILYFLLIRPQQKRQKNHQALVSAVKKGDKVITNSGIIATVSKVVSDHEVVLEIAPGVHCKFVKSTITSVVQAESGSSTAALPAPEAVIVPPAKAEKKDTPADEVTVPAAKSKSSSPIEETKQPIAAKRSRKPATAKASPRAGTTKK